MVASACAWGGGQGAGTASRTHAHQPPGAAAVAGRGTRAHLDAVQPRLESSCWRSRSRTRAFSCPSGRRSVIGTSGGAGSVRAGAGELLLPGLLTRLTQELRRGRNGMLKRGSGHKGLAGCPGDRYDLRAGRGGGLLAHAAAPVPPGRGRRRRGAARRRRPASRRRPPRRAGCTGAQCEAYCRGCTRPGRPVLVRGGGHGVGGGLIVCWVPPRYPGAHSLQYPVGHLRWSRTARTGHC